METDVLVVGGGPAGLAAALAARRNGFRVVLADRAQPPIDKACGEGLMPDGVAALRAIGVELGPEHGFPFRGIRFLDNEFAAEASFPHDPGLGIRRTILHRLLMERAVDAGVVTYWRTRVTGLDSTGEVKLGDRTVRCRWIVGADGSQSQIRQWAGLHPVWNSARRIGLRQHFRIRPWTDFVEVYWRKGCQAYVTPVGPSTVCVALLSGTPGTCLADLPAFFPALAMRLGSAEPIGHARGAFSMSTKLGGVTRSPIALIGDASGTVDAVTGEGMALAFRQAAILGTALAAGDLARYEAMHRRTNRMPLLMGRLLLLMDGNDGLRRRALRALAAQPRIFDRLLAAHIGARRPIGVLPDFFNLIMRSLASKADTRQPYRPQATGSSNRDQPRLISSAD